MLTHPTKPSSCLRRSWTPSTPTTPVHVVRQAVHDLDLSAVHDAYRAERGRPPFHPEAMVGLLLYGACRGIYSSRKLARACCDQITFMYLTGLARPDFHTIAQFRKRFRPQLKDLFHQVLELCRAAGLVRLGHHFTDPESRIMHTPDGFQQCYNAQAAVDAESQIIVACEVSRAPPDVQRLRPMLERIREENGRPPAQLSADAGYASEANFAALDEANVYAVIALRRYRRDEPPDADPAP